MTHMKIDPLEIRGPWSLGFTLDTHTISSEFLGYDPQGNPQFDTVRSEIGETLFQCKYRGDRGACEILADVAAEFVRSRKLDVDVVVPIPPSKVRSFQPLDRIASGLAARLGVTYDAVSLRKVKETPEVKSMSEMAERETALRDAFDVHAQSLRGRTVLLFDDLYRSGASMGAAAQVLRAKGGAASVIALALTRTRSRT